MSRDRDVALAKASTLVDALPWLARGRPDVPVYAGCPRPLRGDTITAVYFHGETGLGPVQLPDPRVPLQKTHGVAFTIDLLRQVSPDTVTWCALGPLTNIATALVQAPDATYVDTTGMSIDDVEAALLKIIRDRTSNGKERTH